MAEAGWDNRAIEPAIRAVLLRLQPLIDHRRIGLEPAPEEQSRYQSS
jgi:hypothetical protein